MRRWLPVALAGAVGPACTATDADTIAGRNGVLPSSADVVSGPLQVLVADGLDGTSWLVHRVVVDGQPVELNFGDGEAPDIGPKSIVEVWGHDDYETFAVDGIEVLAGPPQMIIDAEPYAPRRLAVILIDFGNGPEVTATEADEKMWSADYASRNYWSEISYGKESLEGDIFGPFTLPSQGCNSDGIASNARQALLADGGNPADYDQFMYVFPNAGCGWGGLAMLGYPDNPEEDSWYNGQFGCVVRNQEVAHNYGIMHTHFYQCSQGGSSVPFSGNCSYVEYGSPYDPMGYGCGHMATPDKAWMGWLEGCNIVDANVSGTFNLLPTETPCNGTQALRLPTFDGRKYWLEYRQPVGFDTDDALAGVLVHVNGQEGHWGPDAYLIDLGVGGFLREGESYSDPEGAVTFIVQEEHPTHAVIDVVFPDGGSGAPACADGTAPAEVAGAYGSLECTGGPFEPDGEPPTVAIASPGDEAFFAAGESFDVRVEAQDESGVFAVALYLDDVLATTKSEPPWQWEVNDLPLGTHTLFATAT
ncbi:MAG: Ig-like domain-containing protein, partial [Myxococcota bacterium]